LTVTADIEFFPSLIMRAPKPLLLDFANLTVFQGDRPVLRKVSLQIRPGEQLAILGPNGSGKSALIKTIFRELYPIAATAGYRFNVLGKELWDLGELHRKFGIVSPDLLGRLSYEVTARQVTAREFVLSGFFSSIGLWPHHRVTPYQEHRAREIMAFLEIGHLASRPHSAMSAGEQRRALIGRALAHDPEVLILDEPTNSLDPGAVREFHAILRKLVRAGKSLILVTHHVADIFPEIKRVIFIKDGSIIADGPKKEILTSASLSRLFGRKLKLIKTRQAYDLVSG
jgi:iron complex transport system ATP-binding protein